MVKNINIMTALDYVNMLPSPYREEAIEHLYSLKSNITEEVNYLYLCDALKGCFVWSHTKQGHKYWHDLYLKLSTSETKQQKLEERDFKIGTMMVKGNVIKL